MTDTAHFDRWGPDYDQDEVHPNIVRRLLDGLPIAVGARVLDVATGTGLVALEAARRVGPTGTVVGIDIAEGMLAEARRKREIAGLEQVSFVRADAEALGFPSDSFDVVLCSCALVLMHQPVDALRLWASFLKPGGILAFDTPAKPFGLSDHVAAAAASHGVRLAYADFADTTDKCEGLISAAGLDKISIRRAVVSSVPVTLAGAIAMYDDRLDHPAWQPIRRATPATQTAIRADFIEGIRTASCEGVFVERVALNFVVAGKGAPAATVPQAAEQRP